mgnify:CR=1 FL=1
MAVSPEILTASLTLIGGILIFLIQKFIILLFIQPYQEFKEAKSKLKYLLLLNKNIYTNGFDEGSIKKEFKEKVLDSQTDVRKEWANLYVKYDSIILKWFAPKSDDMKKVYENLIYISNSPIIRTGNRETNDDPVDRNSKIDYIFKVLK